MPLSPESFDHLLAQKLAQSPEPNYDPAHWDQLEDQLEHLNQMLQQQAAPAPAQPAAPAPAAGGWLAGPLAKLGFVAALTGLTATNAWLITRSTTQPTPAPVSQAPTATPAAAPVTAAPTAEPASRATNSPAATAQPTPSRRALKLPASPSTKPAPAASPAVVTVAPPPPPTVVEVAPVTPTNTPTPERSAAPEPVAPLVTPDSARRATVTVEEPATTEELPNIITPNGDGKNDRLVLPLPVGTYRLLVYDVRTGRLVYDRERYDNSWDAAGVPDGVYRYVVRPDNTRLRPVSSRLEVNRR